MLIFYKQLIFITKMLQLNKNIFTNNTFDEFIFDFDLYNEYNIAK